MKNKIASERHDACMDPSFLGTVWIIPLMAFTQKSIEKKAAETYARF
jgi:hypothetical protein